MQGKQDVRQESVDLELCEARLALGLPTLALSDLACAKAFFVLWGLVAHIEPRSPSGAQVDSMRALAALLWELRSRPMMAVCPDCMCTPPSHAIWCTVGRRSGMGALLPDCPKACGNYWEADGGGLEGWRTPRLGPCVLARKHRGPCSPSSSSIDVDEGDA